jgi:hypothetical protein
MDGEVSKLITGAEEKCINDKCVPKKGIEFRRNKVLFNENKYWIDIAQKSFLGQKRYLYNKKNKKAQQI